MVCLRVAPPVLVRMCSALQQSDQGSGPLHTAHGQQLPRPPASRTFSALNRHSPSCAADLGKCGKNHRDARLDAARDSGVGRFDGKGGNLARSNGTHASRFGRPKAQDDDRKSTQRPGNRGAAWVAIPFGLVVLLKVITAFQGSLTEGIGVLAVVATVLAGFIILFYATVFLTIQWPAQRRSNALRRLYPAAAVYVARNIVGFTTGIITVAPELSGTNRHEYYGLVTDEIGFTLWHGPSPSVKVASVGWNQLQSGTVTQGKYLGKRCWQASFTTTSGHPLNMSLSHRLFGTGQFSEAEANEFVAEANEHIEPQR